MRSQRTVCGGPLNRFQKVQVHVSRGQIEDVRGLVGVSCAALRAPTAAFDKKICRSVRHSPRNSFVFRLVHSPELGRAASIDRAISNKDETFPGVETAAIQVDEDAINRVRRLAVLHVCDGEAHELASPERFCRTVAFSCDLTIDQVGLELTSHESSSVATFAD